MFPWSGPTRGGSGRRRARWIELNRAGYDDYRDLLDTPAFFALLPEVLGLFGLDLGCGEGHNTRLLADDGAWIIALDTSEHFILPRHPNPALRSGSFWPTARSCPSPTLASISSPGS